MTGHGSQGGGRGGGTTGHGGTVAKRPRTESSRSEIAIEGKRTHVASERQHQIDNEVYEAEQRKLLRQEKVLLKKVEGTRKIKSPNLGKVTSQG
ncbi:hypothetical protein C8J56DRAFT_1051240 [Mycena floridula]|nr:hypothetical protein C8J56DRAFT_1051240 [Mycena floridula]